MIFHTKINDIKVNAYTIPTDSLESDGTLEWDSTTIVIAEINADGKTGIGYSYSTPAAAVLIKDILINIIKDMDPLYINKCNELMTIGVRNLGIQGIAANAISALDSALWDLKAKTFNVPLVTLLGQAHEGIEVYGSGGFTSYSTQQLQKQLSNWVLDGIKSVKMKIGREPDKDLERVKKARESIGNSADLYVDANGGYSKKQALAMAEKFTEYGVTWFEEPVSSDNLQGLNYISLRAPSTMEIAAGEYGYDLVYFKRMLEAKAVDVIQADATRCGGITGFLKAAVLAEAFGIKFSAHTAPSIHLHPSCAAGNMKNLEYFHDHVRIESLLFDGVQKPVNGILYPDLSRPGMGIEFKRKDAEKYRVI